MSLLRGLYLVLAAIGASLPIFQYMEWARYDWSTEERLTSLWFVVHAVESLAPETVVMLGALIIWIIAEVAVRRNLTALVAIPVALLLGVACGFPLYLFLRTRPVA